MRPSQPLISLVLMVLLDVIRVLVLITVLLCFAGCVITYNVNKTVLPTSSTYAMVQQLPLTIGFYAHPSIKSKVFAEDAWRVPIGESATATFRWALGQMFTNVIDLEDAPSPDKTFPGRLSSVVELSDISYTYTFPRAIHYEICLYSPKCGKIAQWLITSSGAIWDQEQSSLLSLMQTVGSEVAYLIRDATAQFMVSFSHSPEVQFWLAGEGIAITEVRPVLRSSGRSTEGKPVVLLVPNMSNFFYSDASRGMACVGDGLRKSSPPVEVIPMDSVRLDFYPWLEPSTAPKSVEEVRSLLSQPAVQQKARKIGVRYILEFHGGTKTEVGNGWILCGVSSGGGGCLGFAWGNRESSFSATVLDMWSGDRLTDAVATQHSGVYIPAFIVPVPILAPTESKACEELTRQIHSVIMK